MQDAGGKDQSPIPSPKDEDKSVLENLGLDKMFERKYVMDVNTRSTDFIPLPGLSTPEEIFYYINLSHLGLYTSIIFSNSQKGFQPIAHVDYEPTERSGYYIASFDTLSPIVKSMEQLSSSSKRCVRPPDWLIQANEIFCRGGRNNARGAAIEVDENYQGRGLSKTLIYLALAQAEMDGIEVLRIGGDGTKGKRPDKGESLYEYFGAKKEVYEKPAISISFDGPSESKEKMSKETAIWFDTRLNDTQISVVKNALK